MRSEIRDLVDCFVGKSYGSHIPTWNKIHRASADLYQKGFHSSWYQLADMMIVAYDVMENTVSAQENPSSSAPATAA